MFRQILFIFCAFAISLSAFAQLPNQNGQIWREYPVIVPMENTSPLAIVEYIRRETGEAAWIGDNFGLISCDGQKLYVYHAPPMQQRVAEIIARFMRPETQNVQFVTKLQFHSFSKNLGVADIRQPIYQYLNPILEPDGTSSVCKTPGVTAYWVAKENVPKFREALESTLRDIQSCISIEGPGVMTFNGQTACVQDITNVPYVADVAAIRREGTTGHQPIVRMLEQGRTIQTFSLLSWDCQMVTSDVSATISALTMMDSVNMGTTEKPIILQVPQTEKIEFSGQGLTWSADGMLVVFYGKYDHYREHRIETGPPIFNKIPYIQRLFNNTAIVRDSRSVDGILTVEMITDSPQQATRQGNIVR